MKKNILLVDDDQICNFLTQQILLRLEVANEIYTALNGREALKLLTPSDGNATIIPDLILLDLNMPIMDGFAFLDKFKDLQIPGKENISIVIVSSSQNSNDVKKAMDKGVDHYLTKPISIVELKSILGMPQ
jgi:CheY-like chemotaxis protein